MFEAYTYERLLEDVLNNAPEGIDTRQGSIFYDAVSGPLLKIAKLYTDLDLIVEMTTFMTATDEALDEKAREHGIARRAATRAQYRSIFDGVTPKAGERFYYDGAYFLLKAVVKNGEQILVFEAETAGEGGNAVYEGMPAVPVSNIDGLISATFGEIFEHGTDEEDDESLRTRVMEKISGPAENGNRQHYKTWCESIDGVGRARIFPLWLGENTVKAVLIDGAGKPCSESKVTEVQNYIDPAEKGMTATVDGRTYTVGDGLGNGVANIGAHFTAVGANPLGIVVSFSAELASSATKETVRQEAAAAIETYFKELSLTTDEAADIVVRISAIGASLSRMKSLLDYKNLRLNGGDANIIPGSEDVPVLTEVVVE